MEAGQLEEKQESSARKQSDHVTNGRLAELDQLVLEKRSTLERLPDKDSEEAKALQEEIRVHEAEVSRMKPEGIGDGECFPNDKFAMHPTFIASNSYLDSRPENRGPK